MTAFLWNSGFEQKWQVKWSEVSIAIAIAGEICREACDIRYLMIHTCVCMRYECLRAPNSIFN